MLFALGGLLLVIWLASLALKVTFGAIHLLVVLAVVLFVIGFIRGRTGTNPGVTHFRAGRRPPAR